MFLNTYTKDFAYVKTINGLEVTGVRKVKSDLFTQTNEISNFNLEFK